jgi:chromosome segregation ATPase
MMDRVAAKTLIPMVTVIVALVGLVGTSFWWQKQQIESLHKEMDGNKEELTGEIAAQGEKIMLREAAIRAMSEDLVKKGEQLTVLEKTVQSDRDVSKKAVDDLRDRFESQKGMVDEISRRNKELEARMKEAVETTQMLKETVQQQINGLKKNYTESQKEMLLLKESVLVSKQDSNQGDSSSGQQNSAADSSSNKILPATPVDPSSPNSIIPPQY